PKVQSAGSHSTFTRLSSLVRYTSPPTKPRCQAVRCPRGRHPLETGSIEGYHMSRTKLLKTGRFRAKADDGREFDCVELTRYTEVVDAGWWTWVPGEKSLELTDGTHVGLSGGGTLEILPAGPMVRRM